MNMGCEEKRITLRAPEDQALQEWGEHTRVFSQEPEDHLRLSRANILYICARTRRLFPVLY